MSDLQKHIASLREAGPTDSSGVFTVDQQQMLATLARYQLAVPEQYVLLAVSAAVAGGASYFKLERCRDRTLLCWDGQLLTEPEMQALMPRLAETDEPRLKDLAYLAQGIRRVL